MEQWHYDSAVDLDAALIERLRILRRRPNIVVSSIRMLSAIVVRAWLRAYHRIEISGRDNLPLDRSFVLIANHASHLDTLCLLAALPIRRVNDAFPVAANDYFCANRFRAFIANIFVNAMPFDRLFAPWESLSACAHLLNEPNTILVYFPEGTRLGNCQPGEFTPGVAMLVAGRDIPVVPCHIAGAHSALPKGAWIPRPRSLQLNIGAPRMYRHLSPTKECAKEISRDLREAVISLGQDSRSTMPSKQMDSSGIGRSVLVKSEAL